MSNDNEYILRILTLLHELDKRIFDLEQSNKPKSPEPTSPAIALSSLITSIKFNKHSKSSELDDRINKTVDAIIRTYKDKI